MAIENYIVKKKIYLTTNTYYISNMHENGRKYIFLIMGEKCYFRCRNA